MDKITNIRVSFSFTINIITGYSGTRTCRVCSSLNSFTVLHSIPYGVVWMMPFYWLQKLLNDVFALNSIFCYVYVIAFGVQKSGFRSSAILLKLVVNVVGELNWKQYAAAPDVVWFPSESAAFLLINAAWSLWTATIHQQFVIVS